MLTEKKKCSEIKIIIIGDSKVGKTSFITMYTKLLFLDFYYPTTGSNFSFEKAFLESKPYNLQMWDIPEANISNPQLTKEVAKDAHGAICMADATNSESIRKCIALKKIVEESIKSDNKYNKIPFI